MEISTIMRYQFTPIRVTVIKKKKSKCRQDVEKLGTFCIIGWNVNGACAMETGMMVPPKTKHRITVCSSNTTSKDMVHQHS